MSREINHKELILNFTPAKDNPFLSICISIKPKKVPTIVPLPPKILVPPRTTAVIASSSNPIPISERVVETLETKIIAANDAANPEAA